MATTLGSKATGSIIKLKENGTLVDFYVSVHDYESDLNGAGRTLVVRKDGYDERQWHGSDANDWASCDLLAWLNSTYLNLLDANVRALIGATQYKYTKRSGYSYTVTTRSDAVFQLSITELGLSPGAAKVEGSALPIADALVIAYKDGNAITQWTRTPYADGDLTYPYVFKVDADGGTQGMNSTMRYGSRPAFTLPASLYVSDDGSVYENTAPTAPGSITVPQTIYGGSAITVSWGAASDEQGNLEGYILERSVNGGSTWSQIYQGSALSTTNTVQYGTYSVMYRVKAYDSEGLESGYKTSSQVMVINNTAPTAPGSITVPETILAGGSAVISWTAATDSQGDTLTYQLERSTNGGSTWTKIYDGGQLSYTDAVGQSWATVRYRVRAYDVYTAYSPYTTGDERTVYQLKVSTLTVPALAMEGQSIPVSWAAVPVADNYQLDRKASSDADWVTVYTGPALQHTEPVGAWTTAQFRVRAAMGDSWGEFTVSQPVPVVSAAAMVISGEDSDLGTLTADVAYTVSSNTGNPITVERRVNGLLVATVQVQSGFAYTIPVVDLPTGAGTIQITATVNASEDAPVTATRTWSYTKQTIDIPAAGAVAVVARDGRTIFPPTLAECVRVPTVFGGSLDKALELLLPILGAAVTAVGSYVGSGTYGQDSPNTLTLAQEPEVVTISGNGRTLTISNTVKTEGGTVGYIEGTTVTWYNDQSAEDQLNQEGVTYTYTAVSKGGVSV